jgi:hypothetical protein
VESPIWGISTRYNGAPDVGAHVPIYRSLTRNLSLLCCLCQVHDEESSLIAIMAKSLPFPRLRAAAVDGRLSNAFVRQEQLKRLHSSLIKSADSIQEAIIKDSGNTKAEAAVEFSLALACVKRQVASLNPEKELEDEYRVAKGKDAADRREAIGIVYIEPINHTFFYSVVVPLSMAIAAGNCVIVQVCLCLYFNLYKCGC